MRDHVLERLRASWGQRHSGAQPRSTAVEQEERPGEVLQTGSAGVLFHGDYSAVTTVGEEFGQSRLGIGVMHDLDGEIVSINGTAWCIPVDGRPRELDPDEGIAFGSAAHGGVGHVVSLATGSSMEQILIAVDMYLESTHVNHEQVVCAIEIVGTFTDVILRTEAPPTYEHEPLGEVLERETRFEFDSWDGTLVGFRFPDLTDGEIIPGLHLHAMGSDLLSGGHVRRVATSTVAATVWIDELHPLVGTKGTAESNGPDIDFDKYEGPLA